MRNDDQMTMRRLEQRVRDDVEEQAPEYVHLDQDHDDVRDWLHELVDGHVPVMNANLLECVLDDLTLGFPDDFQEASAGTDNVYGVIARSIFDRLRDTAEQTWAAFKQEDSEDREARREAGESRYRVKVTRRVDQVCTVTVNAPNEATAIAQAAALASGMRDNSWRNAKRDESVKPDAVNLDALWEQGKPEPEL